MNSIYQDIFKAVHEGKWISIEYKNKDEHITKYWIAIYDINVLKKTLIVEGMHLFNHSMKRLNCIYIDSIVSSSVIEGTYYDVNKRLIEDIYLNPHKYKILFNNVANLKILNYLEDCNRMDATPYRTDFNLIRYLDNASFKGEYYVLNDEQFGQIISDFQYRATKVKSIENKKIQQLGINVLSMHTGLGLYVLAYRKLKLDVKSHSLHIDEQATICTEFVIDGVKESVRRYLDADEYELLNDFDDNQEKIKDCIQNHIGNKSIVDDMPYISDK